MHLFFFLFEQPIILSLVQHFIPQNSYILNHIIKPLASPIDYYCQN